MVPPVPGAAVVVVEPPSGAEVEVVAAGSVVVGGAWLVGSVAVVLSRPARWWSSRFRRHRCSPDLRRRQCRRRRTRHQESETQTTSRTASDDYSGRASLGRFAQDQCSFLPPP